MSNQIRDEVSAENEPLAEPSTEAAGPSDGPDTRSPLERFRTHPKKTLSVTDLISPAWCELQYWYTLSIHGKKKRTPAMRQGSKVHKTLEEQVYTTVKVDVQTKEDAWGLRIWNVIQGLRTLRTTGLTRELEVWCTIDGLVVNGVIDELTYICPDVALENSVGTPTKPTSSDQTTIADFFKASGSGTLESEAPQIKQHAPSQKIYLGDVKTRSAQSLPSGAAFRPTKFQLMLYHHLLSNLASNEVDFSIITDRYHLDPNKVFSDSFIAEVGSLNNEVYYDAQTTLPTDDSDPQWSQDSMETLLVHNTLSTLWSLMISEFQLTLPHGAKSLGNVLKAEYRSRDEGQIMGSRTLLMDDDALNTYIEHEMKWWKGMRPPEGVTIEEAYKCRSCEFAEGCEWRLAKVEEAREKSRLVKARKRSAV